MTINRAARRRAATLTAGFLSLVPALAFAQQPFESRGGARKGTDPAPPIQRQGFSVVLLLGDTQGADAQDTVPPAARRALADMKDFLPYKHYRLLDTQWTLCCSNTTSAFTRLRGLDEQEYELELRPVMETTGRISVRFVLRESADAVRSAPKGKSTDADKQIEALNANVRAEAESRSHALSEELFRLEREQADLNITVTKGQQNLEVGVGDAVAVQRARLQLEQVNRRIATLKESLAAIPPSKFGMRPVIDTSFRMDVGETVVVGTSRLKGGTKALIALLTAVPSSKSKE